MSEKKTILVTGGAGFIGSHITDEYIKAGFKVIVLDNLSTGSKYNINKKAKFYRIDIFRENIDKIFKNEKIDVINHHAAQIDLRKSQAEPELDANINIIGTIRLLDLAVNYGVKKFIFASSGGAVYGEQTEFPATESHKTEPLSPYGISKLSAEKYISFFSKFHKIKCICLRYANVYGPRQSLKGEAGVVSIFCRKLLKEQRCIINGKGDNTRDYVFVGDVAKANLAAIRYSNSITVNIGTGLEISVKDLYRCLENCTNTRLKPVFRKEIKGEQKRSSLNFEIASKELNWKPQMEFEKGIAATYEWFRNNLSHNY